MSSFKIFMYIEMSKAKEKMSFNLDLKWSKEIPRFEPLGY